MIYYINYEKDQENNAGNKAPDDIAIICSELHYQEFSVPSLSKKLSPIKAKLWILCHGSSWWHKLKKIANKEDTIIYQHPMYGNRLALRYIKKIKETKGCRFVAIIHDLESLRNGVEGEYKVNESTSSIADNQLLKLFDFIICHNERMINYLVSKGFERDKLINLEIFDYLCNEPINQKINDNGKCRIAIAGNLNWGKSRYVYEFGKCIDVNSNIVLNVYGNSFDQTKATAVMQYHGSFSPDVLPSIIEGDYGLVWDGISAESCVGNTGEYLKYNDPHKTSLYIASGIPVIVWSNAAIADFINTNNIGIKVDSLYEIEDRIKNISNAEYNEMRNNTVALAEKLRSGYFTKKALNNVFGREDS